MERDWFKSSYSQGDNTDCLEVAFTGGTRLVRDSKNPSGPVLTLTVASYRDLLATLKSQ
ncbi:uncharacterized protein DUF397 [Actinocorallia herbida]|uniref:Uncharacterized protein DUF397 n=1 Tax=Actinocorallia herbida TaxID=58109 RepID=A0A3N1CNU8_9ACTN|nr:DUF397 domain-containing protein [Actinocorallia herbida]ROO82943.1 uncharacterized protein DUF397 [Actinocorallia herbida]